MERSFPTVTTLSGVVAAFLASLCCVGPVVFAAIGVGAGATGLLASTAGVLNMLVPYRPRLIGLTVGLLGWSFYLAYRSRPAGGRGTSCRSGVKPTAQRTFVWIATITALVLVLAPYWLGL